MSLVITKYSQISQNGLFKNGQPALENDQPDANEFFKKIYKHLDCGYPKFYKMDNLSKLAFLGVENLLEGYPRFESCPKQDVAIVLQNRSSSLDTDLKHQESISDRNNYFPSPAVFVYTLPNIMLGEICIRHKIKGENSCFLAEYFEPDFIENYVNILFAKEGVKCCITGWADFYENNYQANLFLIERENAVDAYIAKFEKAFIEQIIHNNGRID